MNFLVFRRSYSTLTQTRSTLLHSSIKALLQQGCYLDALLSYAKECRFPLRTSIFTLPSLLKACGFISNLQYGKTIHSTIIKMGVQLDPYITTALVDMYVKCGSFVNASHVFETVPQCDSLAQDVTLWNSLLDGFFKFGLIDQGMAHFCRMQLSGVKPDRYSLSILLGALDTNLDIRSGKQIHGCIIRNSFQDDPYLVTALIEMYSNHGRLMEAWCVFDRLEDKKATIVVLNAMINGFRENGCFSNSLELYSFAKVEGCRLTHSTFSSALVACSRVRDVEFGRQVHCDVVKVGFEDESYVCTSLLTMYAKCGSVEYAKAVFDSILDKNVEIWNSMISAYVGNGKKCEALEIYNHMRLNTVPSDSFTISNILVVCCSMIGLYDYGRTLHAEVIKRPIHNNIAVLSSLLGMYSKCGDLKDAVEVFNGMEKRDMVAWGAMISAYGQHQKIEEALNLFKAMELDGIKSDPNTVATILSFSGELGNMYLVLCFHGFVIKRGLDSDSFLGTSLMNIYTKYGQPESVEMVFSNVLHKNLVVWNCLISCYCQNGLSDLSISLLPQIIQHGLYPDSVSITTVLLAISSMAALLKGKAIHGFQIRHGIPCDIQVENAMVDMYMKCGALKSARGMFKNMSERNLVTWNTMIGGYGSHGDCLEAINLFNEMRTSAILPDDITFLSLLSSCNHAGLIGEGLYLFHLMKEYKVEPRMEHYVNIVNLLGRAGFLNDAYGFVKDMPIEPDQGIWLSLLSACRLNRNVELGEIAAHNLLKMDPNKGSNFIQLLNLYVEAGSLEKAAKLRASMREKGLHKTPGCSWIEVQNQVYVFFSGDTSSRRTFEIHEILRNLRCIMERTEESLDDDI